MKDPALEHKDGILSIELLFRGSKSEDQYPLLTCADGSRYRIHLRGNPAMDARLLAHLEGQFVRLWGKVDEIKGHKRIVIDPNLEASISIITDRPINDSNKKVEDAIDTPLSDQCPRGST
jgi:hypothetical protein